MNYEELIFEEEFSPKKQSYNTILSIQASLSSSTINNGLLASKDEKKEVAQSEIDKIVSQAVASGLKTKLLDTEIKHAIDKERVALLRESFFQLSVKIINDVVSYEAERQRFKSIAIEDLIFSEKIAQDILDGNTEELEKTMQLIFRGEGQLACIPLSQSDTIWEMFLMEDNSASGLVFLELFHKVFYKRLSEKKPPVHAPIFESVISFI